VGRHSLFDWVQIVTGIAVVVGLGLLIWELKQNREIASAQIASDNSAAILAHRSMLIGEEPASVVAKACDSPEELTSTDIEIMNNYFWSVLNLPIRISTLSEYDFYSESDWKSRAYDSFATIHGFPYGRFWWSRVRYGVQAVEPEIARIGDESLAGIDKEYGCSGVAAGYAEWITKQKSG